MVQATAIRNFYSIFTRALVDKASALVEMEKLIAGIAIRDTV